MVMGMLQPLGIEKGKPFAPTARQKRILQEAAPAGEVMVRTVGFGQLYLEAAKDSEGNWLDGSKTYHLRVPKDEPVAQFWSVTLYEAENASGLANGQSFPSIGSRDKPAQNADGSTDLYFGPESPEGKGSHRSATVPGKGYFAVLRLYGPTEAAIEKIWKPGDLQKKSSKQPCAAQRNFAKSSSSFIALPLPAHGWHALSNCEGRGIR